MPETDSVKLQILAVTNTGATVRRISVTSYAEWVLGASREMTRHHVRVEMTAGNQMMLARNYCDPQFASKVAFSAMGAPVTAFTAARDKFIGRNGTLDSPAWLRRRLHAPDIGTTVDPCAALQTVLEIPPGETREVVCMLGATKSPEAAALLYEKYASADAANAAADHAARVWRARLGTISVKTPEPTFDLIVNQWSLYQALSCRMWARTAVYQSSGAFGFRDQLQDTMAFVYAEPAVAREHIVRCASRQFEEGDVQHWWHPHSGRGVRTRFSDDLVWLPYVVNHYIAVTGDHSVLDEQASYLEMRHLEADEHEIYDLPKTSELSEPVYDHCVRALRRACTSGVHGLPLIGIGDWNDGMNRVGVDGKGESVWLAWFLIVTMRGFALHAERRGDTDVAAELRRLADSYNAAVESEAWDGEWYRRAYYDDGAPLGSKESDECKIDSIAQSWSVISGAGDPERQSQAMQSLRKHLVRDDARLIMLLTPPFDKGTHDPGYIQGYLPGVRENGAQYTHAALWAALATALLGDGDEAVRLYQMINPVTHALTPEDVATYKVEPYVVAADVYTAEGHLGRGGWTWYTGSASWLYRVGLEGILGFTKRGDMLEINPCIPKSWNGFSLEYRFGDSVYCITVNNPSGVSRGVASVMLDDEQVNGPVPLASDGRRHEIVVTLGENH
jgi:cyclic beta-1,2-glucan synthetase